MISKINNSRECILKIAAGLTMLLLLLAGVVGAEDSYELVLKIPSTQQYYFNYPSGIAVDSSGNVYVADTLNNHIRKFSASGGFLDEWGSNGTGDGQFNRPTGIAVDSSGNVYIADRDNHRIQKFSASGSFLAKWGSSGSGDGQFSYPYGVAVDSSGNVYIADTHNHRIQKFNASGGFLAKWGSSGTGDGQFSYPKGVSVDSGGKVYVADTFNNRIQKFSASGGFLAKRGSYGIDDGQFYDPSGIAVDSSGNVYVADTGFYEDSGKHSFIQKFSASGGFLAKWGGYGTGDGQFVYPEGVAVDSSGNVYVADTNNHRIQKFKIIQRDVNDEGSIAGGSPPPAILSIDGNEQTSGIGSSCWKVENETYSVCGDTAGTVTPTEPLITRSPFTAHLHMPLPEPPEELYFSTFRVTDNDELKEFANGVRVWSLKGNAVNRYKRPFEREPDINLTLAPGLYVFNIGAEWKDKGSVSYGFLVKVYEPEAKVTNNVSSVEKTANVSTAEKTDGFEVVLAITALLLGITIRRNRKVS